jgi:hypothetical protein
MNKEKNVDLESLFTSSRHIKVRAAEGWMAHYIAEILLNLDNPEISKAEQWIQKAIGADQRNGTMFFLGKAHALYANLFKRKGSRGDAVEQLGKAIEILKECGADEFVRKYEGELAKLK